jgi:hypothetical protein
VLKGTVDVALGVEQIRSGLFLTELGLEGGKKGSGPGDKVFSDAIFVGSPF